MNQQKRIWQQEKQQQQQDNKLKPKQIIKREKSLSFAKKVVEDVNQKTVINKEISNLTDGYLRNILGI